MEAFSPISAKSANGLIYYKQYSLYFTAYGGTINLKWPGVFLFMYLFIWEEAGGTLGHYQLILLRGVFLWAEEIVCFDLNLCRIIQRPEIEMRPRLWSWVCGKKVQNHTEADVTFELFRWTSLRNKKEVLIPVFFPIAITCLLIKNFHSLVYFLSISPQI